MNENTKNKPLILSTGIPALDATLQGIQLGDNIVWQVDSIDDYALFVHDFCRYAYREKQKLIYFRFAAHKYLIPDDVDASVYEICPEKGFETFLSEIHKVIEHYGEGANYVFDCLSDLAVDWYSDVMLANFFMLTCPYLYILKTATYFALIRNHNASHAIKNIHNTAQVIIDLYKYHDEVYIHPLKVEKRHTPTMYMLHKWIPSEVEAKQFSPVWESATNAEILTRIQHQWLDFTVKQLDHWTQSFHSAQTLLNKFYAGKADPEDILKTKDQIIRMCIARANDERLRLASKYLELEDLLEIGKRMIGTGLIGGKSVGMIVAQAILKRKSMYWVKRLEVHDSFFIGSDVFYTYLVINKIWWERRKTSSLKSFMVDIENVRKKMENGKFPEHIVNQFQELLEYFGQAPIIVRSSSLLEDAYGNAFSGKYESVFLANQGTPEERLTQFIDAIRRIYTSTIDKDALNYRKVRGLLDKDEQMALLVQRVSGRLYGQYFFPQIAGVGFSFNPFVWDPKINPKSGFIRLVFGLGTRAVERTEDDYTRIVALNKPTLRPEHSREDIQKFSQKKVDVIDIHANKNTNKRFEDVVQKEPLIPLDIFADFDDILNYELTQRGRTNIFTWYLTFNNLLGKSSFPKDMENILSILEEAYGNPVDIEFTGNFRSIEEYQINLLQCRPFQVKQENPTIKLLGNIPPEDILFQMNGPIIGTSTSSKIDRLIYVVPAQYGILPIQDRYQIARIIGKIAQTKNINEETQLDKKQLLIGPGRWGTSSPSLGIPVSFTEINKVSIIGEIAEMHEGLIPDVSLGSHFFNDLVELDMVYFAFYPNREGNVIRKDKLSELKNCLQDFVPDEAQWGHVIKVIEFDSSTDRLNLMAYMNSLTQKGVIYLAETVSDMKI